MDELLRLMHADERRFWESGDGSPRQREEFLEGIKARWREVTPHRKVPFANPSKEYARRERIQQAIFSGQRPDPEDLAEERADEIRYQREVAEAFERKDKELSAPKSPPTSDKPKKVISGNAVDPKPKEGMPPHSITEPPSHTRSPDFNILKLSETPTSSDRHWVDDALEHPLLWGVLTLIAFAIGFTPKGSTLASVVCLVLAWLLFTRMIYTFPTLKAKSSAQRRRITLITSLVSLVIIAGFGWWLIPLSTSTISDSNSTEVKQSPTTTSSPSAPESGRVTIFFHEEARLEATEVKYEDIKDFEKALNALAPTLKPSRIAIDHNQKSVMTNVILRNVGKEKIRNIHVAIISSSPIKGLTNGAKPFSPTQVNWDTPVLSRYSDTGEEAFFTVSVPTPSNINRVLFTVIVYGDNLERYAAAGALYYERQGK